MNNWDQFDPRAYVAANYAEMQADDETLVRLAAEAFLREPFGLRVVDIGTGPNLYPLLAIAPRAGSITACEIGAKNVHWLRDTLSLNALDPTWTPYWTVVRDVHGDALPESPFPMLRDKVEVHPTSIFDLDEDAYDAASMFFCAESITQSQEAFERALYRWAACVRPGGLLVAAFMVGSRGYQTGAAQFPAVKLSETELRSSVSALVDNPTFHSVPRMQNRRSGYESILFVSARAR